MTVAQITEKLKQRAGTLPTMDVSMKLNLKGEGIIHVDSKGKENVVSNDDLPADCTITISMSDFQKLINKELNPMTAVMMGKLKIDGDMSVAMKLQSFLSK
jgi:putative sterol carrier protein